MNRRSSLLVLAELIRAGSSGLRAVATPQFQARTISLDRVSNSANASYKLFMPDDALRAAKQLPLVIYLHGAGAKGSENEKPCLEPMARFFVSPELQEKFPVLVMAPQCRAGEDGDGRPNNWVKWKNQRDSRPGEWRDSDAEPSDQLQGAMAALKDVIASKIVDTDRIYLTGVSMGGSGAWYWSALEPDRFAAVLPVCGLSEPHKAGALRQLPIWTFQGELDETVPAGRTRAMVAALRRLDAPVRYSEFAGVGHGVEPKVREAGGLLPWLFTQKKRSK